jgi:hypothetical protein
VSIRNSSSYTKTRKQPLNSYIVCPVSEYAISFVFPKVSLTTLFLQSKLKSYGKLKIHKVAVWWFKFSNWTLNLFLVE